MNGLNAAIEAKHSAIQIFVEAPHKMSLNLSHADAPLFRSTLKRMGILGVVHGPYIFNVSDTPSNSQSETKAKMLRKMLYNCQDLGCKYLVVHPGSCLEGADQGKRNLICRVLNTLSGWRGETQLLLETDAGGANKVGSLADLIDVVNEIGDDRVGICLDTAHAFAEGLDLADPQVRHEISSESGRIKLLHLNEPDPKVRLGCHLDRHNSKVGEGVLGPRVLTAMAHILRHAPMIFEARDKDVSSYNLTRLKPFIDTSEASPYTTGGSQQCPACESMVATTLLTSTGVRMCSCLWCGYVAKESTFLR